MFKSFYLLYIYINHCRSKIKYLKKNKLDTFFVKKQLFSLNIPTKFYIKIIYKQQIHSKKQGLIKTTSEALWIYFLLCLQSAKKREN